MKGLTHVLWASRNTYSSVARTSVVAVTSGSVDMPKGKVLVGSAFMVVLVRPMALRSCVAAARMNQARKGMARMVKPAMMWPHRNLRRAPAHASPQQHHVHMSLPALGRKQVQRKHVRRMGAHSTMHALQQPLSSCIVVQ